MFAIKVNRRDHPTDNQLHSKVIHFSKLNIDTFTFVISVGILIVSVDPKVTLSLQDPDIEFISDLQ